MSRLPLIPADTNDDLFQAARAHLGGVPNMVRAMANSPALLHGYLGLYGALSSGHLQPEVREKIALAVARRNGCDYCTAAHTFVATHVLRLDPETIETARAGRDHQDPAADAALVLATQLIDGRGALTEDQWDAARADLDDEEIAEVVGHVALNVLTNYFNRAADVDIDFPSVALPVAERSMA
jgi:AhpD family alkylhydroperoxidase